jgi:hypothetical protein
MSVLTRPRPPLIDTAIDISRDWCEGHIIDGSPALGHALKVARKVGEHLPSASPDLIAAVILHDAPYFAPADINLDRTLAEMLSPALLRIVRAIEAEHEALGHSISPSAETADPEVLVASAADKVVSIAAITLRARRSGDPAAFWSRRRAFIDRVPYFQAFAVAAEPHLPASLVRELAAVITSAVEATTAAALFAWSQPGCAARHAPDR